VSNYVSFPSEQPDAPVEYMVMNLVDPATDAGAVARLVSQALAPQHGEPAALFNVDPLVDYRAMRPWLNFKDGQLQGIWRDGILLSHARDMEGKAYLHLHGQEPDFHWDALVADMLDIVARYGVRHIYSFTAIGSPTPHTRPVDMLVRSSKPNASQETLHADFWFQSSFADYFEYQTSRVDLEMTNIAVRVPMYLVGHHYSAGAVAALNMVTSISGLRLPVGDLEQDAASQQEELSELMNQNEDLTNLVHSLEKDYDEKGGTPGFVTAPRADFVVPSLDEIGRAAEQFLAQVDAPEGTPAYTPEQYDPQGLTARLNALRERKAGGTVPPFEVHNEGRARKRGKHAYPRDPE
jgi:hypothetical protein